MTADASRILAVSTERFQRLLVTVVIPWFTILGTERQEVGPTGYRGALAWSESNSASSSRFNAYVEIDGKKVKINRDGTQGVVGGFDGGLVSFDERKGGSANAYLYDVARGKRRDPGKKVNSRSYEYLPVVSGPWLMFGRVTHGGRRRALPLYNRKRRTIRKLDSVGGPYPALVPGQVNGKWVSWFDCSRDCVVSRYDTATRKTIRVPKAKNTRDVAASVGDDGTIYFERAGYRCGQDARIMKYKPGRRPQLVRKSPPGFEITATFVDDSGDGTELLIGRLACKKGQLDVLKLHEP